MTVFAGVFGRGGRGARRSVDAGARAAGEEKPGNLHKALFSGS